MTNTASGRLGVDHDRGSRVGRQLGAVCRSSSGYCEVETEECVALQPVTSIEDRHSEDVAPPHETSAIPTD